MPTRALSPALAPKTYAELRRGVEAALLLGQREVERAKVHTYWETGRLINDHILLNGDRADYGAKVFSKLEADLKVSKRVLSPDLLIKKSGAFSPNTGVPLA